MNRLDLEMRALVEHDFKSRRIDPYVGERPIAPSPHEAPGVPVLVEGKKKKWGDLVKGDMVGKERVVQDAEMSQYGHVEVVMEKPNGQRHTVSALAREMAEGKHTPIGRKLLRLMEEAGGEVFVASTRGRRYEIKVTKGSAGTYDITEYTGGRSSGRSSGVPKSSLAKEVAKRIQYAKKIDNISYKITVDKIGVKNLMAESLGEFTEEKGGLGWDDRGEKAMKDIARLPGLKLIKAPPSRKARDSWVYGKMNGLAVTAGYEVDDDIIDVQIEDGTRSVGWIQSPTPRGGKTVAKAIESAVASLGKGSPTVNKPTFLSIAGSRKEDYDDDGLDAFLEDYDPTEEWPCVEDIGLLEFKVPGPSEVTGMGLAKRYLPKGVQPSFYKAPAGLYLMSWEHHGKLYGIAFQGKGQKPLWYHNFGVAGHSGAQSRLEKKVADSISAHKSRMDRKVANKAAQDSFEHGFEVGDVLYTSWGYDQTNVEWFEVVGLTASGKSIKIRRIGAKSTSNGRGSDHVMPLKGKFLSSGDDYLFKGKTVTKKVIRNARGGMVKISAGRGYAYKWDGRPQHQTASGWGH